MFMKLRLVALPQGEIMPSIKRLSAPLVVMSGAIVATVALALPASAADGEYPAPAGTDVLGTSAGITAAGASSNAAASEGLAFTGGTVAGIGALGGLLLVGGTTLVVASRRRKVNA
jgi:hypothetical protein